MAKTAAVILAGGQGTRLGGARKAELRLSGRTLLQWVREALQSQADPILISVGQQPVPAGSLISLPDLLPTPAGPVAGIAAAVRHLGSGAERPEFLLSAAVDTPFFPREFVERASEAIRGRDAVIAAYGAQLYPTNALWRFDALEALPERHLSGTAPASPKALASEMNSVTLDWALLGEDDPFVNLNTIADLIALTRRARG